MVPGPDAIPGMPQQSALDPQGPVSAVMHHLGTLMYASAAAVCIIVAVLAIVPLYLRLRGRDAPAGLPVSPATWIAVGGGVIPALVVASLFVYSLRGFAVVASPPGTPAVTIDVIGHLFWWEVRYHADDPERPFETANEIHIPAGLPVLFRLTGADVIHSFWIPQLQGKKDLTPGHVTTLWLEADRPGVYRGQCAEYCGIQHANMAFLVVAEEPEAFAAWAERQRAPAGVPAGPPLDRGYEVFLERGCAGCHAIRGTEAAGRLGPDLTHVASRRTLAAVTIPNTRGHMGGWIAGAQGIKPGSWMPSTPIADGPDFRALLDYMESLE